MLGALLAVIAASAAASLTVLFIYQVLSLVAASLTLVLGWQVTQEEHLDPLAPFAGGWGARAFFFLLVVWLSSWTGRKAGGRFLFHGLVVGLGAAVAVQLIFEFRIPPVEGPEAAVYLVLGATGGYLGAARGRAGQDRTEALYRANQAIAEAKDPAGVAAAVGENLRPLGVCGVALWRVPAAASAEEGGPQAFEPWSAWPSLESDEVRWLRDAFVTPHDSPAETLLERRPVVLRPSGAGGNIARAGRLRDVVRYGARSGARAAFLIPLLNNTGDWVGVLAVVSRRRSRPFSPFASPATRRGYLALSSQAALALENVRLVTDARERGEEEGELRERERLRGEVHDTVLQDIQAIFINIEGLLDARIVDRAEPEEVRVLRQVLRRARNASGEMRALLSGSRPEPLEESHDLPETITDLARRFSEETGVRALAETYGEPVDLASEVEDELFKAAREGMRNVVKHARASRAKLTLSYLDGVVALDVRDDGVGPGGSFGQRGPAAIRGGDGLRLLRARVERLGGDLALHGQPGKGTTLTVRFPLARPEEQKEERTA